MKNKNTKMITIRLPINLYNDLKFISSNISGQTMSKMIIFATYKDIKRYLEIIKNGYDKTY